MTQDEHLQNHSYGKKGEEEGLGIFFEASPIPICVVDLSKVKDHFNDLREKGVSDLREHLKTNSGEVLNCIELIRCCDVNEAALSFFDADTKSQLIKNFGSTLCLDTFEALIEGLVTLDSGRRKHQSETMLRTLRGKTVGSLLNWSVPRENQRELSMVLFSAIDITHQKQCEYAAWQAHAQLDEFFNNTAEGICVIDPTCTIVKTNQGLPALLGLKKTDLVGAPCGSSFGFPICDTGDCVVKRFSQGEEKVVFDCSKEVNGQKREFMVTASPLRDEGRNLSAVIEVITDITERKSIEHQLVHAQKMESIGQLAAGIAHEINTPTQYVGDNIEFLQNSFEDLGKLVKSYGEFLEKVKQGSLDSSHIEHIENTIDEVDLEFLSEEIPLAISQSIDGVKKISEIVSAMKEFSHPGSAEKTLVSLNSLLTTTITVSRSEWKTVAEMETDFDENLPMVACLPGEFNQAVLNIIVNAAHAIEEKMVSTGDKKTGKITVKTSIEGAYATIRITDTGKGMPESVRKHIFDPFFTTKEVGKGTGQGLAIAHSVIADKHDGSISVDSVDGVGTTFSIRLPLE